jgi:flagellar biosynthesis protein FlhA
LLERDPPTLLGTGQARAIAEAIGGDGFQPDANWIRTTLAHVLALRISVAGTDVLEDVLVSAWRERLQPGPVAEELIGRLRGPSVDIIMERASLREVTTRWATDGPAKFPFLRDGMFEELGLEIPALRFRIDDQLSPGSFAFRINDVVSMPLIGLRPGQLLVNDTAERLRLQDFEAVPTLSPATGQPNALIDAALEARAEAAGLTTWDPIEYLVLTLAEFLRRYGWCTQHRAGVVTRLDQLAATFPALLKAVRARVDDSEITQLLRALMQEGVSTQDHRRILEALVDHEAGLGPSASTPSTLASRLAAVRIALGPAIAQKAARGTDTVVVYLVDPTIERQAIEPAAQLQTSEEPVLEALGSEIESLPPTAQVPRVLTFARSRGPLQRLFSQQYPRVAVLAHEELPANISVQPVARLALAAP